MMRALLLKELRELRPWGFLSIAAGVLDVVVNLLQQVDLQPLGRTFGALNDESAVLYWLIAFAIGTGITTREHDDGTLAFLDGLPVSRSQVFFAKCIVTIALVLLAPLVRFASMIVLHLLSRGSLDQAIHPELLLPAFGLQVVLIISGVMFGAALGRMRSLAWLVTAVLAAALLFLVDHYPRAALLNPFALRDVQLTSTGLVFDHEALWTQLALSCLAFLVAWHGLLKARRSWLMNLPRRPVIGALVTLATLSTGAAIVIYWATQQPEVAQAARGGQPSEPYFPPSPPAQTQTRHYRFSYPAEESQRARVLADQADAIFERVHTLLGVAPGELIDVDASGSTRNTHGTAYFGRIRMQLNGLAPEVLAHETAHVVAQRSAGAAKDWLWQQASTLNEGLAEWVRYRIGDQERKRDAGLLVLAALQTRRELVFDELVDGVRLGMVRDENLKYPAGEALVNAVVRLYGEAALPRLVRTFADSRLPTDLRGPALWQAVFQLAGMNLGAVVDEFYREITAYAAAHKTQIAALPRPRVRLVVRDGEIGAQALIDDPQHAERELVLRFKPQPDSGLEDVDIDYTVPAIPVWRDRMTIAGARVCVQAGLKVNEDQTLFEPWACLPVSDAVEWPSQ